ncbi:Pseudouridine-5'-phosphate glycosidase [Sesamum angolense]|uniref:Pseudouridine-5'-phosphate glycosidase n=1 Tax=Sesamum angolense TaxID=2727404 RepID=A0AAE1X8Z1_9LAMI|nr:Pseudouridine-5'-phosphate glycosidase [Sesamum angolense]
MASSALSRIANLRKHFNPTSKGERGVKISSEVAEALALGKAVVALESTIISHGMPYPQNLETAKEVEAIVRQNGAIPATIAILDGLPCVANGGNGATTVSATMFFAAKVGIAIFVTGGIGGVHRHGESTLDISSDLTELGRTPVAVVSAGVKSILDIPRTLEYLAPSRVDSPEDCARLIDSSINLGLTTGILIALPIPREHSASGNIIESAIQKALKEAREQNVTGSAETPFLLARVSELTGGTSLASNIALVKNNARLGAQIAVALCQLREHRSKGTIHMGGMKSSVFYEPAFLAFSI